MCLSLQHNYFNRNCWTEKPGSVCKVLSALLQTNSRFSFDFILLLADYVMHFKQTFCHIDLVLPNELINFELPPWKI